MPSEQYKRLCDWINFNSRNDSLVVKSKTKYTTTEALNDLYELEKIAHAPKVISDMPIADTSMPILPRITNYQCLIKERDEAVQLLTKVCEHVADTSTAQEDKGNPLYYLDEIDGLVEWWLKQKPKSEREHKLDKIRQAIEQTRGNSRETIAEHILQALGE